MQRDILWLLDEAGEENLACLRATLGLGENDDLPGAIAGLKRLGFVADSIVRASGLPAIRLTSAGRLALRT